MAGYGSHMQMSRSGSPVGSPGRYGGVATDDHLVLSMQSRLAEENGEKEATKIELGNLKQSIDLYRRQLIALADEPQASAPRMREVIRSMDSNLREKLAADTLNSLAAPGSPNRAYDVLRQSLTESQKRCDNLNTELMGHHETNEELMGTLATVKDANKRLLDQIREQTDELTNLTQLRIMDEERMESQERRHGQEREHLTQETQRRARTVQQESQEKYDHMKQYLTEKLRGCNQRLGELRDESGSLRNVGKAIKADLQHQSESLVMAMETAAGKLAVRVGNELKSNAEEKALLNDLIHELEVKLATEKDLRHTEVSTISQKHSVVASEKNDIQAKLDKESAQLLAQAEAIEQRRGAELQAFNEERQNLDIEVSDLLRNKSNVEGMLDTAKRNVVSLETHCGQLEAERKSLENLVNELHQQLRESDDALAAAVQGNEHLRTQMEEQQKRYHDLNERQLAEIKQEYEERIASLKQKAAGDLATCTKQLHNLEEELTNKAVDAEKLRLRGVALEQERSALGRDRAMWKSQYDMATKMRHEVEKAHQDSRLDAAKQRSHLQEVHDQLRQKNESLDSDLRITSEQLAEFKKVASVRDQDLSEKIRVLRGSLESVEAENGALKSKLDETQEALNKAKTDLAHDTQRGAEINAGLERELQTKMREHEQDRRRLEARLEEERKTAMESRNQYTSWRSQQNGRW